MIHIQPYFSYNHTRTCHSQAKFALGIITLWKDLSTTCIVILRLSATVHPHIECVWRNASVIPFKVNPTARAHTAPVAMSGNWSLFTDAGMSVDDFHLSPIATCSGVDFFSYPDRRLAPILIMTAPTSSSKEVGALLFHLVLVTENREVTWGHLENEPGARRARDFVLATPYACRQFT